jgi:hypothetical protein
VRAAIRDVVGCEGWSSGVFVELGVEKFWCRERDRRRELIWRLDLFELVLRPLFFFTKLSFFFLNINVHYNGDVLFLSFEHI